MTQHSQLNVDGIRHEAVGAVLVITIDRQEVLNALDSNGYASLQRTLDAFDADDQLRVAILRGAGGRAFSTGSDLRALAAKPPGEPMLVTEDAPPPRIRKPLIAAIDGYCIGGGLEWALRADIRIATDESSFGLPEPRTGSIAGFGLHMLCRLIPPNEALYMQLTGMRIDADRALRCGLVQELVPSASIMSRAHELANEIMKCSPRAVEVIKETVEAEVRRDLDASFERVRPLAESLGRGPDAREGPQAFLEKRVPRWVGQ